MTKATRLLHNGTLYLFLFDLIINVSCIIVTLNCESPFQTAARKITELHNVNANIKRKLQAMAAEKELYMKNLSENNESETVEMQYSQ